MNLVLLETTDFIDAAQRRARLSGRRLAHLRSVCRCTVGDTLRVGLIDGAMGSATILSIAGDGVEMELDLTEPPPPPLPLTLVLALPRPKSLRKSIVAATSLGIKRIFIIESWRVEKSYWSSPELFDAALREQMLLGMEQARDTVMPVIAIRRRFRPFVEDELPAIIGNARAFVAHPYDARLCPGPLNNPAVLLIGPEGGFIPFEIDLLKQCGCIPVTIGRRILRVETAIAAFAGRLF